MHSYSMCFWQNGGWGQLKFQVVIQVNQVVATTLNKPEENSDLTH